MSNLSGLLRRHKMGDRKAATGKGGARGVCMYILNEITIMVMITILKMTTITILIMVTEIKTMMMSVMSGLSCS